jgi:hypothetical protein
MADQGYSFGNLLNNQFSGNWKTAPNVGFKGRDFQSFLQPNAAEPSNNWNRSPQSRLNYKKSLIRQGNSLEDVKEAMTASPPLTTEEQGMNKLFSTVADIAAQNAYWQTPEGMREQLEMGKEMAKEQAKQTLKFQTLANIPGQVERALSADKYYAGISQIPEIYRSAFASVPSMNIQAPGYSAPQTRYFN